MKVIFVIANMGGGGSERVIANLAENFAEKNIEVTILMTSSNDLAYKLHKKTEVICIGTKTNGNILKRMQRIIKMRKYFKQNKSANIISFGTETNLFVLLATVFLPNQIIISERNDPNKCSYKKLRNLIYKKADKVVFQTEDAKNHFTKDIQSKGVVIGNPISQNILDEVYVEDRDKKIVAVGRLTKQKNQRLLLNAFSIFYKNHEDFKLIIYGKGELEDELKQHTKELGIEENVIFEGFHSDVLERIRNAAMYVLSSDYEGISNSLMEAMASGIPSISTDCPIGGAKMLIQNKENGILVPMNEEKELAKAMASIADNKELSQSLSKQGRLIKEKFSLEKISNLWIRLLKE